MGQNEPVSIERERRTSVLTWLHLVRIHLKVSRGEHMLLACHGLTVPQFDVLSHLAAEPGLSQQALAGRLLVTKGNVAGLIDRLEAAGLVERCAHPEDRRAHQLYLTEAGRARFAAAAPELEARIDEQFAALDPDEQTTLLRLVGKLDRSLKGS